MMKSSRFLFLSPLDFCSVALKFAIRNAQSAILVCAMLLALCMSAEAQQQTKVPRIGYLAVTTASAHSPRTDAFRQGLRDLGYVEGQNIFIEYRFAEGNADRLTNLAAELVRLKEPFWMPG